MVIHSMIHIKLMCRGMTAIIEGIRYCTFTRRLNVLFQLNYNAIKKLFIYIEIIIIEEFVLLHCITQSRDLCRIFKSTN